MMASLKSELRKLLTVRSTYIIVIIALLLLILFAGIAEGYNAKPAELHSPDFLTAQITGAVGTLSTLGALVGLLLFAHEYRYNTILYTLTSSRSRLRSLIAKTVVVTGFAVVLTLIAGALSPLCSLAGIHLHHHGPLVAQSIPYASLLWRCLFFGWGYAMFALIFVAIIRNQIGAIAAFFLLPSTAESILSLLLKDKQQYLPFTALRTVLEPGSLAVHTSPERQALIAGVYLAVSAVIAAYLFVRRDAN